MLINPDFAKPILTLANYLAGRCIPFALNVCWDGLQMRFPWNDGDLICHSGSYGHEYGDVESMGCPWDEFDVTRISVEDAEEEIANWWARLED